MPSAFTIPQSGSTQQSAYLLTLVPATGKGAGKKKQCSFSRKSPSNQWNKIVTFCDIVTDPFVFPKQLSVSLYLLPVLRGRSGSNVHETGFVTSSNERIRNNVINFTDVMCFLNISVKPQTYCWNFNSTFHRFRDTSISGFGRHFELSDIFGNAKVLGRLRFLRACHGQIS